MRGDLGVHFANGLTGFLQLGGNVYIAVCGLQCPWQHGNFIDDQLATNTRVSLKLQQGAVRLSRLGRH